MPLIAEPSDVAICNMALMALGRGQLIQSLDENIQAARVCKLRYAQCRDAVLRAYDWNFATARASLPALTESPAFGFAYQYQLPGDCLFVRDIDGGDAMPWKIEGRRVLTDLEAPLNILYCRAVADPSAFDSLFLEALAARLAAEIADALTESTTKVANLWRLYLDKLSEARRRDAQEGQGDAFPRGSWLEARQSVFGDWPI